MTPQADYLELSFLGDQRQLGFQRVATLQEEGPWRRRPPRFIEDLSGGRADTARARSPDSIQHGVVIDTFESVNLLWSDCLIQGKEFHCNAFGRACDYANTLSVTYKGTQIQRAAGLFKDGNTILIQNERLANATVIEDHVLLATPDEPVTWGLWVVHALPAIEHFVRNRDKYSRIFIGIWHPNCAAMLRMFGVTDREIIHHDPMQKYFLKRVTTLRRSLRTLTVPPADRNLFRRIALSSGLLLPGEDGGKIFISRYDAKKPKARPFQNEPELMELLRGEGFRVINPEKLTLIETAALLGAARTVVGPGGSGMFNAVFCRPSTNLIDIESSEIFLDAHSNLFASMGLDYALIVGAQDDPESRAVHQPWRIDLDRTMAAILS